MSDDPIERLLEIRQTARIKAKRIRAILLVSAVIGVAIGVLLPSRYTAQASFFPESRNTDLLAGFSSLAGLAGAVSGPLGLGPSGSQLFVDLFKSRSFLDSLANSSLDLGPEIGRTTVGKYLVPRSRTEAYRLWKARRVLSRVIRLSTQRSGVVVISVTNRSPYAAAAIANRSLEIIDELNIEFRRRQASARRQFTQQFLQDVEHRLGEAQDQLERFLTSNRSFVTPALERRRQVLQEEVDRLRLLRQQVESNVENARLTEYNDAPVVATVDVASVPERPSGPLRWVIAAGFPLLALVAMFWALYLRLWR